MFILWHMSYLLGFVLSGLSCNPLQSNLMLLLLHWNTIIIFKAFRGPLIENYPNYKADFSLFFCSRKSIRISSHRDIGNDWLYTNTIVALRHSTPEEPDNVISSPARIDATKDILVFFTMLDRWIGIVFILKFPFFWLQHCCFT